MAVDWSTSLAAQSAKSYMEDLKKRSAEKQTVDQAQNRLAGESIKSQLAGGPGLFPLKTPQQASAEPYIASGDSLSKPVTGGQKTAAAAAAAETESLLGGRTITKADFERPQAPLETEERPQRLARDQRTLETEERPQPTQTTEGFTYLDKSDGVIRGHGIAPSPAEMSNESLKAGISSYRNEDYDRKLDKQIDELVRDMTSGRGTRSKRAVFDKLMVERTARYGSQMGLEGHRLGLEGHKYTADSHRTQNRETIGANLGMHADKMGLEREKMGLLKSEHAAALDERKYAREQQTETKRREQFNNALKMASSVGDNKYDVGRGMRQMALRGGWIPPEHAAEVDAIKKDFAGFRQRQMERAANGELKIKGTNRKATVKDVTDEELMTEYMRQRDEASGYGL